LLLVPIVGPISRNFWDPFHTHVPWYVISLTLTAFEHRRNNVLFFFPRAFWWEKTGFVILSIRGSEF
jgi:hypothetical protein